MQTWSRVSAWKKPSKGTEIRRDQVVVVLFLLECRPVYLERIDALLQSMVARTTEVRAIWMTLAVSWPSFSRFIPAYAFPGHRPPTVVHTTIRRPIPPNCPGALTMGFTDFFTDAWETFAHPSPDAEAPVQGGSSTKSPASGTDEESSAEAEVNKQDQKKGESQEQGHKPSGKANDTSGDDGDNDEEPEEEEEEEEEPDPKEKFEKGEFIWDCLELCESAMWRTQCLVQANLT